MALLLPNLVAPTCEAINSLAVCLIRRRYCISAAQKTKAGLEETTCHATLFDVSSFSYLVNFDDCYTVNLAKAARELRQLIDSCSDRQLNMTLESVFDKFLFVFIYLLTCAIQQNLFRINELS